VVVATPRPSVRAGSVWAVAVAVVAAPVRRPVVVAVAAVRARSVSAPAVPEAVAPVVPEGASVVAVPVVVAVAAVRVAVSVRPGGVAVGVATAKSCSPWRCRRTRRHRLPSPTG
jgi:hypothetical protein